MRDVCSLIWLALIGLFGSRASLQVEILTLRHQLNALRRKSPQRMTFSSIDRLVFAGLYRLAPGVLDALKIVRPETVIRWHRAGFRAYWRWKSRPRGGRPKTPLEIRQLIREISLANPLWGAPRLHGELVKLGIDVGQTTVAKYIARGRRPPSQGWKTFLHNHADGIASMDLFVVPTISFRLLSGLLMRHHDRRQILWLGVTAHPTAEWISHQLTEAYGWKVAPRYIIRDRDAVYGDVFIRRLWAMSIRDRPTAPRSPWQNGYCERAIGSIRRECLDHVVVFGERHITPLSRSYATYYNTARTRLSVNKDARRCREQYMPLVALFQRHFLADSIIYMCVFDFRQAQGGLSLEHSPLEIDWKDPPPCRPLGTQPAWVKSAWLSPIAGFAGTICTIACSVPPLCTAKRVHSSFEE